MPKKKLGTVRVRVGFPAVAWARLERLAIALSMDVPTLVRFLASTQLAQMEMLTVGAKQLQGATPEQVQAALDTAARELIPEVEEEEPAAPPARRPKAAPLARRPKAEPEPEPAPSADNFGFRTRSDIEVLAPGGLVVVGEPLLAGGVDDGWTGYMHGL